eukprot:166394-Amorphochlora_amoeboformis.AAC.1
MEIYHQQWIPKYIPTLTLPLVLHPPPSYLTPIVPENCCSLNANHNPHPNPNLNPNPNACRTLAQLQNLFTTKLRLKTAQNTSSTELNLNLTRTLIGRFLRRLEAIRSAT